MQRLFGLLLCLAIASLANDSLANNGFASDRGYDGPVYRASYNDGMMCDGGCTRCGPSAFDSGVRGAPMCGPPRYARPLHLGSWAFAPSRSVYRPTIASRPNGGPGVRLGGPLFRPGRCMRPRLGGHCGQCEACCDPYCESLGGPAEGISHYQAVIDRLFRSQ